MSEKKTTQLDAVKNVLISALVLALFVAVSVWVACSFLGTTININGLPLWLGIVGTLMAFIGNGFVADAATRWGAQDTALWKIGNMVQAAGFALTLLALIIK